MPANSPTAARLNDPLSEVTRRERKYLLGISLLSMFIVKTGLVPTKVSALGVEFNEANQESLLLILALMVLFFLVAFCIYALSDFLAWRVEAITAIRPFVQDNLQESELDLQNPDLAEEHRLILDDLQQEVLRQQKPVDRITRPIILLRGVFEFVVPLGVGAYGFVVAWTGAV